MATQQTPQDFEARQLLKAYRKGLISDELFEAEMREIRNGNHSAQGQYLYNGVPHATEREMIMPVLDEFRCTEDFGAEYVILWLETSDQECVRGGLRVVQKREAYHAELMEARLRELGGVPQCTVPADVRKKKLAFYGSRELKDAGKLKVEAADLEDPAQALKVYTDVVDQIREDLHSKELLHWILQDELNTIRWVKETCALLNPA
jgi:bacterioferritin (cytochrome b1)